MLIGLVLLALLVVLPISAAVDAAKRPRALDGSRGNETLFVILPLVGALVVGFVGIVSAVSDRPVQQNILVVFGIVTILSFLGVFAWLSRPRDFRK